LNRIDERGREQSGGWARGAIVRVAFSVDSNNDACKLGIN